MIGLGLGLSLGQSGGGGSPYTPEANAYFAAMTVQPDAARKGLLNTLIASLVSGGVWAKLDWLTIHAAHDEQAGRVNMVTPAQVALVGVAPTFTTDRGYTGNGTTQYLNTNWNSSTAGGHFTQNDCHMGVWLGTDVSSGTQFDVGHSTAAICGRNAGNAPIQAQSTTNTNVGGTVTSVGHQQWSRTGATAGATYKNGVAGTTIVTTSAALRNAVFLICANNSSSTGTVTPVNYSTRRNQAVHWGSALTAGESLALYNALATYMAAIGA